MKKLFLSALALVSLSASAQGIPPYGIVEYQGDPGGTYYTGRFLIPSNPSNSYLWMYDGNTTLPIFAALGTGLNWNGTTLSNSAAAVNADWNSNSGLSQILNKPTIQAIQRTRATTNTSGVFSWTFPSAYGTGVIPIIEMTVEDNSAATWNHQITAISNTGVTIQLTKTTAVTVLGVSVLGVAATPQAVVHLTAVAP